jgi:hypothetical protein
MIERFECDQGSGGGRNLFENLCAEINEGIVLDGIADLDRVAADLAVFHIRLTPNREIEDHRNFFPAIRACEGVFHFKD